MKETEIALLMKGMAPVIGRFVSKSMEPLADRIAELEQKIADMPAPKDGADGIDGKDGADGRDGAHGAPGRDGKDAEPPSAEEIGKAVAEYLAAHPVAAGKDGRDGSDGVDGAPGIDGKDAEPVTAAQIADAVAEYLLANPPAPGKDGRDGVDGKDGAPGVDGTNGLDGLPGQNGKDGSPGANGSDGKDGVGLAGAVQSKDGHLVVTLTNGATVDVGMIAGRDGRDGEKGADGLNGRDGLGFDDLDLVEGDEGVFLRFAQGEVAKEFPLPIVFDRGVFREGGKYLKGNGVTWGGSYWIAQKDGPGKPDTPDSGWRLAVKKGQNGRDAGK